MTFDSLQHVVVGSPVHMKTPDGKRLAGEVWWTQQDKHGNYVEIGVEISKRRKVFRLKRGQYVLAGQKNTPYTRLYPGR